MTEPTRYVVWTEADPLLKVLEWRIGTDPLQSLQVLEVDCASCELRIIGAVDLLRDRRGLLWRGKQRVRHVLSFHGENWSGN